MTREQVRLGRAEGLSYAEIARRHGLSKATVAYHARRLGEPVDDRCNRRYDWDAVQRYYDEGHSITACQARFGFARKTFNDARLAGKVRTRPQGMPIDALLAETRNRRHIRQRLQRAGLLGDVCEICGLREWLDRPLSLQLHHVNGDGRDNRLDNLQLLCPNCHSQTDTWGGRNRGRQAAADEAAA